MLIAFLEYLFMNALITNCFEVSCCCSNRKTFYVQQFTNINYYICTLFLYYFKIRNIILAVTPTLVAIKEINKSLLVSSDFPEFKLESSGWLISKLWLVGPSLNSAHRVDYIILDNNSHSFSHILIAIQLYLVRKASFDCYFVVDPH